MRRRQFLATALSGWIFMHIGRTAFAGEPAILLAEVYRTGIDPAAYWISEKLDGVRAIWDGQNLRFRSGNPVHAPDWFIRGLPATPLDGELWMGRGSFERLSGIVRKDLPLDSEWREVRYMIFELPHAAGDFSARVAQIRHVVRDAKQPWLQAIEQYRVSDATTLQNRMDTVVKAGGEGLMLHRADAPYLTGRSDVLLKLKPWEDAEAKVVAHLPGKGRNAERLGALQVETPDGRRFRVGSGFTDLQRTHPPAIGSTITYRFRAFTRKGLPRFPTFVRIREDF